MVIAKFKVSSNRISKVEIIRETEKSIFYYNLLWDREVREAKHSNHTDYFDSFEEAKDFIVSENAKTVETYKILLADAIKELEESKALVNTFDK